MLIQGGASGCSMTSSLPPSGICLHRPGGAGNLTWMLIQGGASGCSMTSLSKEPAMKQMTFALLLALPLGAQAPAPKAAAPAVAAEPTIGAAMDATYQWVPAQFIGVAEAM